MAKRSQGSVARTREDRVLSPAFLAKRWKPGQSGNSAGHSPEYGEVVALARTYSVRAIERICELAESEDERVAMVACTAILDRAFGKPQPHRPDEVESLAERLSRMSPEERAEDVRQVAEQLRQWRAEFPEDEGVIDVEGDEVGERGEESET